MDSNLLKTNFYFPENLENIKNKDDIVQKIVSSMKKDRSIDYAGFSEDKELIDSVSKHLGNEEVGSYHGLSDSQKEEIEEIIHSSVKKCNEKLPLPTKLFIFIFPWFSSKEEDKYFNGVMGLAPYSCVFHLFINPKTFTKESLGETVAHELNHTVFYYNHYNDLHDYTLLDHCIIEGLAENFREDVMGGDSAPWSIALSEKEAFKTLESVESLLNSNDQKLHKDFLFGNDKYEKWSGYSVGYWVVKNFIKNNKSLTWEEIMKRTSSSFLDRL